MKYLTIPELVKKYEKLKMNFNNGLGEINEIAGWRVDMKFQFHLTLGFPF